MVRTIKRAEWALPPVVADLHELSRSAYGVRNVQLLDRMTHLAAHPAIAQRTADGLPVRHALAKALEDLASVGGGEQSRVQWTAEENEAVKALLFIPNSVHDGTHDRILRAVSKRRAEIASELVEAPSEEQFRRRMRDTRGGDDTTHQRYRSLETDLLTRFVAALGSLEAAPSHTRDLARTPLVSPSEPAPGIGDLVGTWQGVTESTSLLKARRSGRSGSIPCFMVVENAAGVVQLRWLYRHGVSLAVAVRIAATSGGRRMVVVYEADLTHTLDAPRPSHRGACLLDVVESNVSVGASGTIAGPVIAGPYWTDRQTQGTLRFTRRVDRAADDFAAAAEMFSP